MREPVGLQSRSGSNAELVPVTAPRREAPVLNPTDRTVSTSATRPDWAVAPVLPARFPDYLAPAKEGRKRILVGVKHVTKLGDDVRIEADGKHIPLELFEYQMNEFDDVALEQALRTAESVGNTEVVVVTIGPPAAESTIRRALAKGADRAVRVWAEELADADPIVIARMLAGVGVCEQPDLIFCGVQSSDQAHGATGAALARLLGMSCAAVVVEAQWDGSEHIRVTRELEGGTRHRLQVTVPAVLTVQTGANVPRYATMRMVKEAKSKPIAEIDAAAEAVVYRATSLAGLALPPVSRATMLSGSPDELADQILQLIRAKVGEGA